MAYFQNIPVCYFKTRNKSHKLAPHIMLNTKAFYPRLMQVTILYVQTEKLSKNRNNF